MRTLRSLAPIHSDGHGKKLEPKLLHRWRWLPRTRLPPTATRTAPNDFNRDFNWISLITASGSYFHPGALGGGANRWPSTPSTGATGQHLPPISHMPPHRWINISSIKKWMSGGGRRVGGGGGWGGGGGSRESCCPGSQETVVFSVLVISNGNRGQL